MKSILILLFLVTPIHAQWLPEAIQKREKQLWLGTGVTFINGLKFYDLPKVSQRLSTVNGIEVFGIYPTQDQYPWATPAGLDSSPKNQWRVARAAFFPKRIKIVIKQQTVPPTGQYQPYIDWSFPDGTIFAEILIRKYQTNGNKTIEWPFELRIREKQFGKWDQGTAFRPIPQLSGKMKMNRWTMRMPPGKLADFGIGWSPQYQVDELPPNTLNFPSDFQFKPSPIALISSDSHSFVPENYSGSIRSCSTCHDLAGSSTTYANGALRGSDTILSFHPFKMDTLGTDLPPIIDSRWRIINQTNLQEQ